LRLKLRLKLGLSLVKPSKGLGTRFSMFRCIK
jgi:hypothetical protein